MLADDTAVTDVALAKNAWVDEMSKGAIAPMSTISVALSTLAQAHADAGQRLLPRRDSARSRHGGGGEALHRCRGRPRAIAACKPLFDAIGQRSITIGTEPMEANLVKLPGNFLLLRSSRRWARPCALVGKTSENPAVPTPTCSPPQPSGTGLQDLR